MVARQELIRNPYRAGPLVAGRNFFGREKIFQVLYEALVTSQQRVVVLSGQRRIGKSSILLELPEKLPQDLFIFVNFDLQFYAGQDLATILYALAQAICSSLHLEPPARQEFTRDPQFFEKTFLPEIQNKLSNQKHLVILIDEFDIIRHSENGLVPIASPEFTQTLQNLIYKDFPLSLVLVVGSNPDKLSSYMQSIFRLGIWVRVEYFDREETLDLIIQPARDTLTYSQEAIDEIYELTTGHPFFTQLLCWEIFNQAIKIGKKDVSADDVDSAQRRVFISGVGAFAWIWNELSVAERVYLAAVALTAQQSGKDVVQDKAVQQTLKQYGIQLVGADLPNPGQDLVYRGFLEHRGADTYQFTVKLVQLLIVKEYPLDSIRIGVSRVLTPVLDFFVSAGFDVYDRSQNASVLIPQNTYNLHRLGSRVYVRVESERVIRREDIDEIVKATRKHYEGQLSGRVVFIVLDRPPDYGARLQMFTYRFSDHFTIVPLSTPQLRQALQTDSCSAMLESVLGDYLGETDLYRSQWPVSDVLGFFGRKQVIDTIQSILDRGEHVALFGLRKMGKTSLMNYQHDELPYPMAVLSLQDVRKPLEIFREAVAEWSKTLSQRFPGITIPDLNLISGGIPPDVEAAFRSDTRTLLDLLEKRKSAPRLVLCLDEIDEIVPSDGASSEAIAAFRNLMGFLRGVAARFKALNLIVCGMRPDINRVNYWRKQTNPVFQSFHEIFLGPFSKEENDEMVKSIGAHMGVDYEPDALKRLYLESGGHPFIARQMCSIAVAKASSRPYTFRIEDISSAVKEYLHNPKTVIYVEQELWGSLHNQIEADILIALARHQPQTETELIPESLSLSKQSARRRALANLGERWLLKSDASGYFIPYDCFRRWIRLNYLEES